MHFRRGLTRIEFLVGLLAAMLLVGCLLGAIFRIRSEANTMNCRNNQRQLVLAVHNYHSTNNCLPMLVDFGKGSTTGEYLASGFALLAIYIEVSPFQWHANRDDSKDAYYAHSSIEFPWKHKDGTPGGMWAGGLVNQVWRVFIDPSDATAKDLRDVPMVLPDGSIGYFATGSYVLNGLLPWGVKQHEEFPGGLSNTILFGERPQVCVKADGETIYNLWGVGFYSPHMPAFATLTPTEPPGLWSTNQIAPVLPLPDAEGSVPTRIGRQEAPIDVNGVSTPIQRVRSGRPCDPRLPGTPHSRGMQVAMCDGSVRVYSHDTSAWVFWKACVPMSNE